MRLDRLVGRLTGKGRQEVRESLAQGRAQVDGEILKNGHTEIGEFQRVEFDGEVLQSRQAIYVMLNKPRGYVSATVDEEKPTVMELIGDAFHGEELHIAGRLDRASTGLLILTNDGLWSQRLTLPEKEFGKTYVVELAEKVEMQTAQTFAEGIYFGYEDITTGAADLEILEDRRVRLTIYEGKYHQVKRMFHAVGNRVVALHREQIGPITLDPELPEGSWRELCPEEVAGI